MSKNKNIKSSDFRAVDFFCGAGGMTSGFNKAGIKVLGGIDIDAECEKTYSINNPDSKFLKADIKKMSYEFLSKELRLKKDDDTLVFIGCSPCQYWSKIKTDKTKSEESKNLLGDFKRFVDYFNPGFIVIENVPGILTRLEESPLKPFLNFLDRKKYYYKYHIVNASNYGVPQTRKRFLLIASRIDKNISLPKEDSLINTPTVRNFIGNEQIFKPIIAGCKDKTDFIHSAAKLSQDNLKRLQLTHSNGGTRMSYSNDIQVAIKSHYQKSNFSDSYSRMFWDKPAPTITTRFNSISNGRFAHPEQNRAISLREGATLQTFEHNYLFFGKTQSSIAKQIGNAVPPLLSMKIAKSILNYGKKN